MGENLKDGLGSDCVSPNWGGGIITVGVEEGNEPHIP